MNWRGWPRVVAVWGGRPSGPPARLLAETEDPEDEALERHLLPGDTGCMKLARWAPAVAAACSFIALAHLLSRPLRPLGGSLRSPAVARGGQLELAAGVLSEVPPLTGMACPNYSPTFPSAGGPDCTFPCAEGLRTGGAGFQGVFPASYMQKVRQAGDLVRSLDRENTLYLDGRGSRVDSHISLSYYCCHPEVELQRIKDVVMKDWRRWWQPQRLNLSYATCAVDGPSLDHVSFIVMLDEASNRLMMDWVLRLEARIQAAGLPVHLSRRMQEPFHTTLGVVNGSAYPVRRAIEALNKHFPPGSWLADPLQQGNLTFWDSPGKAV